MYAQVLTDADATQQCDERDAIIRDRLLPSLRVQEGFCGALHLVSRAGDGMLIVLWETEEQASQAACEQELAGLAPAGGEARSRASVWEVTQRA
jgi:hypothetical protein